MNFVKFILKQNKEIYELLKSKENIGIIFCKKCYEEYTSVISYKCIEIIKDVSKKNIRCLSLNFLCNDYYNKEKILSFAKDIETICVASCGIGVQVVSDIIGKDVITLTDSVQPKKSFSTECILHGISVNNNDTFCAGCEECWLNLTGGICPITECPKSLLNGPCGGAKNGKCEVDKEKDCGWEKIFDILKQKEYPVDKKINLRSFYIQKFSYLATEIKNNIYHRIETFYGGIHLQEKKDLTENLKIERFDIEPQIVKIFLSQHTGKPAIPIVKIGDKVYVGSKIASSDGFISANIHSSVSGKVLDIKEEIHPIIQKYLPAIVIENDGENKIEPKISPKPNWQELQKDELLSIILDKGIVGLGGAVFPTHVKLTPPKPVDTLIINGCECEPYINVDSRIMIEYTKELFEGIEILKKILEVKNIIIAVEDNKQETINILNQFKKNNIEIVSLKTKYPQGAEKILIKKTLGREVPYGGLPFDVGVVVQNVSTVYAIYNAVVLGIPLIERFMTVSGDEEFVKNYGNFLIKIGTPLELIVKQCFNEDIQVLKLSGFMMGVEVKSFNTYTVKAINSILAVKKRLGYEKFNSCIKCGRCVDVCPMELEPLEFVFSYQTNNFSELEKLGIKKCIECSCCEHICSSKIPIVEMIKSLKQRC
jgi:electron transport complex protein RnfC